MYSFLNQRRPNRHNVKQVQDQYAKLVRKYPKAAKPDFPALTKRAQEMGVLDRTRRQAFEQLAKTTGKKSNVPKTAKTEKKPRPTPRPSRPAKSGNKALVVEANKLAKAGKWRELERKVLPALRNSPNDLELIRLRGQAYEGRKNWEAALEWYEQANLGMRAGRNRDELVKDIYRALVQVDGQDEAKKYLTVLRRSVTSDDIKQWIDKTAK